MDITIISRQRKEKIDHDELEQFLEALGSRQPAEPADALGICLVNDEIMRDYNYRFRGFDRSTDVLSFPADDEPCVDGSRPLGDILISVPTARRQATEAGHTLQCELKRLLLHGYLHLLGFDHETDEGRMEKRERYLMRQLLPEAQR
jgi:probable rRNA maturation factor